MSGSVLRYEAERLLPATSSTDPAELQGNCCGAEWSGGAHLWFRANAVGDTFTVEFDVPESGTYDLAAVYTQAADYGIHTLAVDGTVRGEPFDAYSPTLEDDARAEYGAVALSQGTHQLTWTITGKNAASSGFFAGIDLIELELQG
jgi:hypothetical protein